LPLVIKTGYDGLVESKCVSVDSTWSALKFTWPKKGKVYNNSYGQLNRRAGRDRAVNASDLPARKLSLAGT
jgi:hypothetical protein